jgi:hypothetical protein
MGSQELSLRYCVEEATSRIQEARSLLWSVRKSLIDLETETLRLLLLGNMESVEAVSTKSGDVKMADVGKTAAAWEIETKMVCVEGADSRAATILRFFADTLDRTGWTVLSITNADNVLSMVADANTSVDQGSASQEDE